MKTLIEKIDDFEFKKSTFAELIKIDRQNILPLQKKGIITTGDTIGLDQIPAYIAHLKTKDKKKVAVKEKNTKIDEEKLIGVRLDNDIKRTKLDKNLNLIYNEAFDKFKSMIIESAYEIRQAIAIAKGDKDNFIKLFDELITTIKTSKPKEIDDDIKAEIQKDDVNDKK